MKPLAIPKGTVERIHNREEEALNLIVRDWFGPLSRHAYKYLQDVDLAHDVVQETFIRVWTRLPLLDCDAILRNWMYTTTTRLCIDQLRRMERQREVSRDAIPDCEKLEEASTQDMDRMMIHLEAEDLMSLMTPLERDCVLLRIQDTDYNRIARTLQIPVGTVKSRLSRAKRATIRTAPPPIRNIAG